MPRFQGPLNCDTGNPDGHIFISALDGAAVGAVANNVGGSAGNYYVTIPASSTVNFVIPFTSVLFRYGVQDQLQEQWGSKIAGGAQGLPVSGFTTATSASSVAGTNISLTVLSTVGFVQGQSVLIDTVASGVQEYGTIASITSATVMVITSLKNAHAAGAWVTANAWTTPGGASGFPPFTGSTNLNPQATIRPKGILFKEIYPVYQVLGAGLTSQTIGLYKATINSGNAAKTITAILPPAQNGMGLAVTTNPTITPIQVPVANQIYQTTKYTEYYFIWSIVTPASSTVQLDGVFVDVTFNEN